MVVITGGNGRLGRHIVTALHELIGPDFIVTVRDTAKAADLAAKGIMVRAGDFDKPDEINRGLEGGDTLLVMGTLAPQDVRIKQYRTVTDAAKRVGVGRVAFVGYLADQQDSPHPSAVSLRVALDYFRQQGYAPINFRCGNYTEAGVMIAQSALASGRIAMPTGDGKISYVTRRDLARAIAKVLAQPGNEGRNIALTGPAAYSNADLAAFLSRIFGRRIVYDNITPEEYEAELLEANTPAPFIAFRKASIEATRRGLLSEVSSSIADITGVPPEDGLASIQRELGK